MRDTQHLPHYTVNDYKYWDGDWELIDGIPYSRRSSPVEKHHRFKHQRLLSILTKLVGNALSTTKEYIDVINLDWFVSDEVILRPDIAIVYTTQKDILTSPPKLIIEIADKLSLLDDSRTKFQIYQQEGVPYYIIVNAQRKTLNTFILINGFYQEQNNLSEFTIHDNCSITIDIATALAELDNE